MVFCDVAGSTDLGERLDAEAVRLVMGRYFDTMRATVERHGGVVEKFIGDAVMAAFGIPDLHEDDALRAVRAADEMQQAMAVLDEELDETFGAPLRIRVGVCTGPVVAADAGSGERFVTGDTVNVASRLEHAAAPGEVLVGETTYRLVRDAVRAEPLPSLALKGKAEPVHVWRLLSVHPTAAGLTRHLDSALVGRDRELDAVRSVFAKTLASGSGRLVAVVGSAGTGKSRLIKEFVGALPGGARALWGRCLPYGDGITYWPIAEAVRDAAGVGPDLSSATAMARIRALLPPGEDSDLAAEQLAAAMGLTEATASPEEIVWAVRRLLETLAADGPVVLVVDDVHWAEPTLLDLLASLCTPPTRGPVMLLCSARTDLLDERADWVEGSGAVVMRLDPLGSDQMGLLIKNLLGDASIGPAAEQRIVAAAEGNPLFVEELLRMLVDDGVLHREDGGWAVVGDLSTLAVPPSVEAVLAARLDRLAPAERALLQRASVIGRTFYPSALLELSPLERRTPVAALLERLARRQLIVRDTDTVGGEEGYRFHHILSRDAAYASLPKARRARLHEAFARWLEGRAGERLAELEEVVGYHLEQAFLHRQSLARIDDAVRALGREASERLAAAAYRARLRGDLAATVQLVGRALLLLPDDDPARLDLACQRGSDLLELGELEQAEVVFETVLDEARSRGDHHLEARAQVEQQFVRMQTDLARPLVEIPEVAATAERAFMTGRDERGLSRVWQLRGELDWIQGRFAANARALEQALVHADRAGDEHAEAEILAWLGSSLCWGPTPVSVALARCEQMLATRVRLRRVECSTLGMLALLRGMAGDFVTARELAARSRVMLEELGLRFSIAVRSISISEIESYAGDARAAERELRWAYGVLDEVGDRNTLSTIAAYLAGTLVAQERYDEAVHYTELSEEMSPPDDVMSHVSWRGARAKARAWQGRHDEAESLAREAVGLAAGTDCLHVHGTALLDLAQVLGPARARERAALHREALALFERKEHAALAARTRRLLAGSPGA